MRRLGSLALVLLVACSGAGASSAARISKLSRPIPQLSGRTLDGRTLSPADYRGKVVVVNFWATWCDPCRREQPGLQRVWQEARDRGVYMIGVDYRDDPAAARAQMKELGLTYPSLSDPDGSDAYRFGFYGLPATYVVDRSGEMRYQAVGELGTDELRRLIAEVSGSSS